MRGDLRKVREGLGGRELGEMYNVREIGNFWELLTFVVRLNKQFDYQ